MGVFYVRGTFARSSKRLSSCTRRMHVPKGLVGDPCLSMALPAWGPTCAGGGVLALGHGVRWTKEEGVNELKKGH